MLETRRGVLKAVGVVCLGSLSGCQETDRTKELVVENNPSDTASMLVSVLKLSDSNESDVGREPPDDDADAIWEFEWSVDDLDPGETRKQTSLLAEQGTYWVAAEFEDMTDGVWVTGGDSSGEDVYAVIQENGHLSVYNPYVD